MNNEIANNADEFARQLEAMLNGLQGDMEAAVRKAAIDLFSRIVERTPIDTGRAKANWNIGKTFQDGTEGATGDTTGQQKAREFELSWKLEDGVIEIYNNLEYIEPLEDGHSQQAPVGMVSVSLKDFADFFRQAVENMNGGDPI